MHERYFSPEQLSRLDERARALGEAGMARAQQDWAELIAAVEAERARGTDPADPRVRELARRWDSLIEQFTGGDPGIAESLQRMYDAEGASAASRAAVSPELAAYLARARGKG